MGDRDHSNFRQNNFDGFRERFRARGERLCHNCQEPGHLARDCKKSVPCFNCKRFGHFPSNCPNVRRRAPVVREFAGIGPVVIACQVCGGLGHSRVQCPSNHTFNRVRYHATSPYADFGGESASRQLRLGRESSIDGIHGGRDSREASGSRRRLDDSDDESLASPVRKVETSNDHADNDSDGSLELGEIAAENDKNLGAAEVEGSKNRDRLKTVLSSHKENGGNEQVLAQENENNASVLKAPSISKESKVEPMEGEEALLVSGSSQGDAGDKPHEIDQFVSQQAVPEASGMLAVGDKEIQPSENGVDSFEKGEEPLSKPSNNFEDNVTEFPAIPDNLGNVSDVSEEFNEDEKENTVEPESRGEINVASNEVQAIPNGTEKSNCFKVEEDPIDAPATNEVVKIVIPKYDNQPAESKEIAGQSGVQNESKPTPPPVSLPEELGQFSDISADETDADVRSDAGDAAEPALEGKWVLRGVSWKIDQGSLSDSHERKKSILFKGLSALEVSKGRNAVDPRQRDGVSLKPQLLDLPEFATKPGFRVLKNHDLRDEKLFKPRRRAAELRPIGGQHSGHVDSTRVVADARPRPFVSSGNHVGEQNADWRSALSPETVEVSRKSKFGAAEGVAPSKEAFFSEARQASESHADLRRPSSSILPLHETNRPIPKPISEGEWFYVDGMGKEHGGCRLSRLKWLASAGQLIEGQSVFRKEDDLWLPLTRLKLPDLAVEQNPPFEAELNSDNDSGKHRPLLGPPPLPVVLSSGLLGRETFAGLDRRESDDALNTPSTSSMAFVRGRIVEEALAAFRGRSLQGMFVDVLNEMSVRKPLPDKDGKGGPGIEEEAAAPGKMEERHEIAAPKVRAENGNRDANNRPRELTVKSEEVTKLLPEPKESIAVSVDKPAIPAKIKGGTQSKRKDDNALKQVGGQGRRRLIVESSSESEEEGVQKPEPLGPRAKAVKEESDCGISLGLAEKLPDVKSHGVVDSRTSSYGHCWNKLPAAVLKGAFSVLGGDLISIVQTGVVCKEWNKAVDSYLEEMVQLDLSKLDLRCTDLVLESLEARGIGKSSLASVNVSGCCNVSREGLRKFLAARPTVLQVNVTLCEYLKDLSRCFEGVWFPSRRDFSASGRYSLGEEFKAGCSRTAGLTLVDIEEPARLSKQTKEEIAKMDADLVPRGRKLTPGAVQKSSAFQTDGGVLVPALSCSPIVETVRQNSEASEQMDCQGSELQGSGSQALSATTKSVVVSKPAGVRKESLKASGAGKKKQPAVSEAKSFEERVLERLIGDALEKIVAFDKEKFFLKPLKEAGASQKLDLSEIRKKLNRGAYRSVHGLKDGIILPTCGLYSFDSDVKSVARTIFRCFDEKSAVYKSAVKLFSLGPTLVENVKKMYLKELRKAKGQQQQQLVKLKEKRSGEEAAKTVTKTRLSKDIRKISVSRASRQSGRELRRKPPQVQRGPKRKRKTEEKSEEQETDSDASSARVESSDEEVEGGDATGEESSKKQGRNVWSESESEGSEESSESEDDREDDFFAQSVPKKAKQEAERDSTFRARFPRRGKGSASEKEQRKDLESESSSVSTSSEDEEGRKAQEEWMKRPRQYAEKMKQWGNKMTRSAMVPPVTRTYVPLDDYFIVDDVERVAAKMKLVPAPAAEAKPEGKRGGKSQRGRFEDKIELVSDWPEVRPPELKLEVGVDVIEQEVYGIDPMTHNQLLDALQEQWHLQGPAKDPRTSTDASSNLSMEQQHEFIEQKILPALNNVGRTLTGQKAPMTLELIPVVASLASEQVPKAPPRTLRSSKPSPAAPPVAGDVSACVTKYLLEEMRFRQSNWPGFKFKAFRKGLGVVLTRQEGVAKGSFVVEFLGEVYPPWRWFEKQDGVRRVQEQGEGQSAKHLAEFYNIYLERPRRDGGGFDLLVVDAMHRANFASRLCHSCNPNCETKVVAINGKYTIGVYAIRDILCGEELTFDYLSITESMEEYNRAVCLCGDRLCKGSFLSLGGPAHYQNVMMEKHGIVTRHWLLLESSTAGQVTELEQDSLREAGIGSCLLSELPPWAVKYAARLVEFIVLERQKLPMIILDQLSKVGRKRRKNTSADAASDSDSDDSAASPDQIAKNEADGILMNRLQNLAITFDKLKYCLRKLFGSSAASPPPLRRLEGAELGHRLWLGEGSVVHSLFRGMAAHQDKAWLRDLYRRLRARDPSSRTRQGLRDNLLWLRDQLLSFETTCLCRFDAAADLIHIYAYTQHWFTHRDYPSFSSPPLLISPSDLGRSLPQPAPSPLTASSVPAHKWEFTKEYPSGHVPDILLGWFRQSGGGGPGQGLSVARRGCLVLPDPGTSCFSRSRTQPLARGYGVRQREAMMDRMETTPQRSWPKAGEDSIWDFRHNRGLFGSPMFDHVSTGRPVDVEMMKWLRDRPVTFEGPYDIK